MYDDPLLPPYCSPSFTSSQRFTTPHKPFASFELDDVETRELQLVTRALGLEVGLTKFQSE